MSSYWHTIMRFIDYMTLELKLTRDELTWRISRIQI